MKEDRGGREGGREGGRVRGGKEGGHTHTHTHTHTRRPVGPRARVEAELETLPLKKGFFDLVVSFSCDQLSDLMGDQDASVL